MLNLERLFSPNSDVGCFLMSIYHAALDGDGTERSFRKLASPTLRASEGFTPSPHAKVIGLWDKKEGACVYGEAFELTKRIVMESCTMAMKSDVQTFHFDFDEGAAIRLCIKIDGLGIVPLQCWEVPKHLDSCKDSIIEIAHSMVRRISEDKGYVFGQLATRAQS